MMAPIQRYDMDIYIYMMGLYRLYHYMLSPPKGGLSVYTFAPCIFVCLWYGMTHMMTAISGSDCIDIESH